MRVLQRAVFNYALDTKTGSVVCNKRYDFQKYDHTFKDIFQEIFDAEYKEKFEKQALLISIL